MLYELVKSARSCRGFDENVKLSREQLEALVELARLSPSSVNLQPLKYYISCTAESNEKIFVLTHWAGMLKEKKLPYEGHRPTAYIVIFHDTSITPATPAFLKDAGIVAEVMYLGAAEMGLAGCMIGSFDTALMQQATGTEASLLPVLVLALGRADETARLTDIPQGGSTAYYRDENDVHCVPKRSLEEIILNK
ncbi:MAG: nitroreductase [Clostridiales bacterium]|nr:nitroreductase [Clostridiales bacterium]